MSAGKVYYHLNVGVFCGECLYVMYPHDDNRWYDHTHRGSLIPMKYYCVNESCSQRGKVFERKPIEAEVVGVTDVRV